MARFDDRDEVRGTDFEDHDEPREDPFGQGFDRPEPGRVLEHWHEARYTGPYDRWRPRDYVFYSGRGYHREFVEPYKLPGTGRYSGRGPKGFVRSDARIEDDVHRVLTDDAEVDASDVRVRVDGGEVTLEGSVPERAMKRGAEDVVEAVRGVRDVHNRLRVGPPGRKIPIGSAAPRAAEFEALGGGSPPHYDRRAEEMPGTETDRRRRPRKR